ncbi:hypothetical protein GCM10022407_08380 [Hymenobacter antarcticus]|uniref:GLPGLI family protein n=1 Tax=Hymenobacter antarcticus TaxID=486270 RepID=A0ABP7PDZ8_9BACT
MRAIYRFDYKLDSAVATPKSEQTILRINNGTSCFRSKTQHVRDSVYTSLSGRPEKERIQESLYAGTKTGKTQIDYSIIKEAAKDKVFYHDKIRTVDYQYQEKAPLFHWKIMPVKKTVAGYECQQAFTAFGGRTWEAWFTRDIPVSEGPYKFYGLPGLIVKVRDTHDNYVFELLSFESTPKPFTTSATSSAPLIKKAKFKQAKLNDEQTFLDWMASMGNYVSENMRSTYAAKLKRRNNPLELQ